MGKRGERMGEWERGRRDEEKMTLSEYTFYIITTPRTKAIFHIA